MKIDNKLKEIREFLQIKQNQFAKSLDIPLQTYIRYEHNKRDVPSTVLKKIAETYNIDPNSFFNNLIVGDSNIQINGIGNSFSTLATNKQKLNSELEEIIELMQDYATPKLLREIKAKLLKLKELDD
ncbi:helix-turn-helix transcriptional regulator [Campylobacter jejuni]|uniref:helix-turn-helix transcriptional regulator n=1 Tax=Campylobacter TaxID=194 RepID=UPI001286E61E|nr:helix-turn-helix transcriptional regulator [Campylobacter lari]EHZ4886160.1 helix-turn-helix transcriptional regulator [Campylobacter lari]MBT0824401.1 helix-turn-helix transcriptional regulator [Campylobacter lari]